MVIDIIFFIVETKNKKTPTIRCASCWWCFMAAMTVRQNTSHRTMDYTWKMNKFQVLLILINNITN